MIGHILQIIGIIALIWLGVLLISNIIIYIVFRYSELSKWSNVTRDTSIYSTEFSEWYIIPTFSFHFEFKSKAYPTFQIIWLKWIFNMSYHIKTDIEEEAEARARQELIKEENES